MGDSERFLRVHNAWHAPWDESDKPEEDIEGLTKEAFNWYSMGLSPIQVRWRLRESHPSLPVKQLGRAQRAAEKALLAAEQAPPDLRRAMVAAARQTAIQGALATGEWGAALRGLERMGEIAGEARLESGLSESDLTLVVTVEDASVLPPDDSETVSAETGAVSEPETVEIESD